MQKRSEHNWKGIDVSHWQGDIDWQKVQEVGIQFAFIKATEGLSYVDPLWKVNAEGARRAGLHIGFYHFARFDTEKKARKEASHFVNTIQSVNSQCPLVLDLEVTGGLDKTTLSIAAKVFLESVCHNTGKEVMLYTNTNMAKNHLTDLLKGYPLWIAHYGVDRPGENGIWNNWRAFQYSNKGRVPGIKGMVDLDEMTPEVVPKPSKETVMTYTIKKGDTFWELENHFHLPHGLLERANSKVIPTKLQIGQQIIIPNEQVVKHYTIKKGDTFWELEAQNGWSHGTLQRLNPQVNPRRLKVGATIRIL